MQRENHRKMPGKWRVVLVTVAIFSGILVYGLFDPAQVPVFPHCPIYRLTGFECPGCGSQRAIHNLLHGNIRAAWQYNAGLIVAIGVLLFIGISTLLKDRIPVLYTLIHHRYFAYSILFLLLFWSVFRNIV